LTYVTKQNSLFVQTNKAIFKPLDTIQFRIFSIDSESNAVNPKKPVVATLIDPRNNEIGKFDNITFTNGKFEAEWILASRPILGNWRLSVAFDENEQVRNVK
jgi:CD109 antigen